MKKNNIEEGIQSYDVEKMAEEYTKDGHTYCSEKTFVEQAFISGFKAHQELVKDKLFTVEDMKNAFLVGISFAYKPYPKNREYEEKFIQSLSIKTK